MEENIEKHNTETCEHENHNHPQPTIEDIAYSSHYKIDALVNLLIKKGIFTEEDYEKEMDKLYNQEE